MVQPKREKSIEEKSAREQSENEVGVLTTITGHDPTPPEGGTVLPPGEKNLDRVAARRRVEGKE
ncbi:hypothetical protein AVEN_88889-1, partial [Araneus ventricosus]